MTVPTVIEALRGQHVSKVAAGLSSRGCSFCALRSGQVLWWGTATESPDDDNSGVGGPPQKQYTPLELWS